MSNLILKCKDYPDDSFIEIERDVNNSLFAAIHDGGAESAVTLSKESALELAAWINKKYKGE